MRCVPARDFTVRKALLWRTSIHDDPPYQRESSIWSLDKQQLFVDSLLNGYDVPKIYLHDLRGAHPTRVYAVVDGRQRLTTIWRFLDDGFPLAPDFHAEPGNLPDLPPGTPDPRPGFHFSDLHPRWQEVLLTTYLAVVLIQNATTDDIEDLFSRLNNGEPLNAAERRNAIGGDRARMVRDLVRHDFFTSRLRFKSRRYDHLEVATRLALIEFASGSSPDDVPDLRSRSLDTFVREGRRMPAPQRRELLTRVRSRLDALCRIFEPTDPLLATHAQPSLYYLFVRQLGPEAERRERAASIRGFLEAFQLARRQQLERAEEDRDDALMEFSMLMEHGTNEPRSLARRVEIMIDRMGRGRADTRVDAR